MVLLAAIACDPQEQAGPIPESDPQTATDLPRYDVPFLLKEFEGLAADELLRVERNALQAITEMENERAARELLEMIDGPASIFATASPISARAVGEIYAARQLLDQNWARHPDAPRNRHRQSGGNP